MKEKRKAFLCVISIRKIGTELSTHDANVQLWLGAAAVLRNKPK